MLYCPNCRCDDCVAFKELDARLYEEKQRKAAEFNANKIYWEARRAHAFLLREEGLTFGEIAARMGASYQTARNHALRHGREFVRDVDLARYRRVIPAMWYEKE